MKKKHFVQLLALLLMVSVLFTGCTDSKELTDIAPVIGVGIDAGKNDMIQLTLQTGLVEGASEKDENQKGAKSQTDVFERTGKSVFGMFRDITHESNQKLYTGHNQCIILGKEAAGKDVKQQLDFFLRDHESRLNAWVLVSDTTANEILKAKLKTAPMPALYITQLLKNQGANSESIDVDLLEFSSRLESKTTSPVAGVIKAEKKDGITKFQISGMAVFKKEKMVGEMDKDKTRGYLWAMNKIKSGVVNIDTKTGEAGLEIRSSAGRIEPSFTSNNSVTANITVKAVLGIRDISGFQNGSLEKVVEEIRQAATEVIRKNILDCFRTSQTWSADIYGIGAMLDKVDHKKWTNIQNHWDSIYPQIKPEINTDIIISDVGSIIRSRG